MDDSTLHGRELVRVLLKAAGIFAALALLFVAVIMVARASLSIRVPVESFAELFQEAFLLVTALLFFRIASQRRDERGGYLLIAGFFTCLFIRELDAWFDPISTHAWQVVELVFLAVLCALIARAPRSSITRGLVAFCNSRAFLTTVTGVVLLLIYSRLFGFKGLWGDVITTSAQAVYEARRFAEETTELMAYAVIMVSAIAHFFSLPRKK